jgi:hypothetical protein
MARLFSQKMKMMHYFVVCLICCSVSSLAEPSTQLTEVRFLVLDAAGAEAKVRAVVKNVETGEDFTQQLSSLSGRLAPGRYELTFPDNAGETARVKVDLHHKLYVITLSVPLMETPRTQSELRYGLKGTVESATPSNVSRFRVRLVGLGSYEVFDALVAPNGTFYYDSLPLGAYQLLLIDGLSVVHSRSLRSYPYENQIAIRNGSKMRSK